MKKTKLLGAASADFNWARSKSITQASVLAKRANQRLREIEKQGLESASNVYNWIERQAYDNKPWLSTTKRGEIKFNTNFRKMTDSEIRKQIDRVQSFLTSKTSLTKGVRARMEKQAERFNEKTNRKTTGDEFVQFMRNQNIQELFKNFDPSDIMRLFRGYDVSLEEAPNILTAIIAKAKETDSEITLGDRSFSDIEEGFANYFSNDDEVSEDERT